MSRRLRDALTSGISELRHEPVAKRVRALSGDTVVVDTTRALLVWEPRRVVPVYAVPVADLRAELRPLDPETVAPADVGLDLPDVSPGRILDPSIPFAVHTAPGRPADLLGIGSSAFLIEDEDIAGYALLDFDAFDAWYEEDVPTISHPRDPFHRIDAFPSSRTVQLHLDGELLAESSRPVLLFESMLPTRFYFPPEDVRVELRPSATVTTCAYKGHATYWSPVVGGVPVEDLAWSYREPLPEAVPVLDHIAFFDERVDVVLDGVPRERPVTPWSRPQE